MTHLDYEKSYYLEWNIILVNDSRVFMIVLIMDPFKTDSLRSREQVLSQPENKLLM